MARTRAHFLAALLTRPSAWLSSAAAALLLTTCLPYSNPVRAQQSPPAAAANSQPTALAPAPAQTADAPSTAPAENQQPPQPAATRSKGSAAEPAGSITEDELARQLVGKDLFLRGGYLDNTLTFNEHGQLIGHSPQGSYTLADIRISKVRLMKHKVDLEGARYGLHFLGALPYEDPTKAVDRVNITPKKKEVRITIDRELVVKPKQPKSKEKGAKPAAKPAPAASPASAPAATAQAPAAPVQGQNAAAEANPANNPETSDADELKAEIAKAPPEERPADVASVTTTLSPAHANQVLEEALDNVFAQGFDARMMAAMPGFWKLYYEAVDAKADYLPKDPSVLRQNLTDKKARLVTTFEPASNQFAQDYGVAGMAEYHVVVGADGKPGEIAVARPIGFGLDESAVDSIRKATFEPAVKDGKPVPVMLDMVVEFRIYSQRTAVASKAAPGQTPEAPSLPGPYSVQH